MRSPQEVLGDGHDLPTVRDSDRTVIAVSIVVAGLLIVLETLHEWQEVLGGPTLGLEVVPVRSRCTGVHLEIDGRTTAKDVRTAEGNVVGI